MFANPMAPDGGCITCYLTVAILCSAAFVKLGQLFSTRSDLFPVEFTQVCQYLPPYTDRANMLACLAHYAQMMSRPNLHLISVKL